MIGFIKKLFGLNMKEDIAKLISEGAYLVDVRSASEFLEGSAKGAVNIPLDTIPKQIEKFKNKNNIIVFCKSGIRGTMAKNMLKQNGFTNVTNAGTWQKVNQIVNL